MTTKQPTISVIIPVYNGERYLAEAIESVLAQHRLPDEILVVDDGSTDGSAAVVQSFPTVRYLWQAQAGASVARNHGVAAATGEWLAFLDADDLWTVEKLAQQEALLATQPAVDMVFGQVQQFYSPELGTEEAQATLGSRAQMAGYHVGAMLIRRSAFVRVGPFDPQWQVAHFIEWYQRAEALGLQSVVLPEVVMKRRIHTTNLGIRAYTQARVEYVRLMKATLDQRRSLNKQPEIPQSTTDEQTTGKVSNGEPIFTISASV